MKITLDLSSDVAKRLRGEAARRGTTMSELVEAGLWLLFDWSPEGLEALPPLPRWDGGAARVELWDRDSLPDLLDRG